MKVFVTTTPTHHGSIMRYATHYPMHYYFPPHELFLLKQNSKYAVPKILILGIFLYIFKDFIDFITILHYVTHYCIEEWCNYGSANRNAL